MGKGSSVLSPLPGAPRHARLPSLWRTLALSHYCRQSSCSSLATPPPPTLTPPGHFNCNPRLKVFINFSPSPASSSIRSAACLPGRWSSEEHLQFKRDAYARAPWGLKVNGLLQHPGPSLPRRVSGVFYIPLFETLYFLPGLFARAFSPTAARPRRRIGKLAGAALQPARAGSK